jgi:hypothetical protein
LRHGDDALAHHPAGYRNLLEEDVLDALGLDALGDLLDLLAPARLVAASSSVFRYRLDLP